MSEWISIEDKSPLLNCHLDVRIKLSDGSELNCQSQSDGDFYWAGGGQEIFISEPYVTHWMPLPEPPTD